MNIVCALSGIVDTDRPGQGIMDIKKAGFENVLLDLKSEQLAKNTAKLLQSCKEMNLATPIAIAPCLKRDAKHIDSRELLERLAMDSIRLCGSEGCRYLIVRPLPSGGVLGAAWEGNRAFYLGLAEAAREHGITILLENQCKDQNGHLVRGSCADAKEAVSWVDSLNEAAGEERFGFCMNVGTYNLCGQSMRETAVRMGSRVKAVMLRDCDGQQESSLLPFTSVYQGQPKTDWLGLVRGLRETGFNGELVLDFSDTASAFSPLLRPQLLSLARSVGEYFRWQIGIESLLKRYRSIVLFGAGNMCRNYMKCYGEKYPPLFTCDNNVALWGTTFCGLEVRPPESLKGLPEDCAVFICNIYYREIQAQLKGMGIRNPIEFFNDEYMPSFHYDRLPSGDSVASRKS